MGFEHTYTDPDGQQIHVRESADHKPGAYLVPVDDDGWAIPAHRLAEFCGALYEAAGQPVPDLPQIPDPALLTDLAMDLHAASHGDCLDPSAVLPRDRKMAAHLASLGWRKP